MKGKNGKGKAERGGGNGGGAVGENKREVWCKAPKENLHLKG